MFDENYDNIIKWIFYGTRCLCFTVLHRPSFTALCVIFILPKRVVAFAGTVLTRGER